LLALSDIGRASKAASARSFFISGQFIVFLNF
jgi:hypothetical protein